MNLSMQKIGVLTRFKFKELFKNKTFLVTASLVPLMTLLMRLVYQNMAGADMPPMMFAMALNLGLTLNLTSVSMMMPATMLAKDKEKNTLRVLMTSSVNGTEYFISAVIPSFVVSLGINLLILFLSGIDLQQVSLPGYLIVTALAGLTSCILGMLIGLFAKNQMASGNLSSVLMLVLMLVPLLSNMMESLQPITKFLYTGIASNLVTSFVDGSYQGVAVQSWLVLILGVAVSTALFIFNYRKNGFGKE